MSSQNPFRPTRFEHHDHPLIWLSPNVRKLEGLKSVYVAGTRGSGKTSLLKAVNWRERLFNDTVRDQLGDNLSEYVAVYFRLPDYLTSALGLIQWSECFPQSSTPELVGFDLFSQLLEFVSAQLLCEAVSSLRGSDRFGYSAENEDLFVAGIFSRYPQIKMTPLGARYEGLDGLSEICRNLHQRLNVLITRGQVQDALTLALECQPGAFINDIAEGLRILVRSGTTDVPDNFHLKICIDDCETLQPLQQRFLNSLVRGTKHPLFWVVSYVSVNYDSTTTVYNNQTLSDADRTQLILDDMSNSEFFEFCQGVSLLRIYYSTPSSDKTSLYDLPGNFFSLEDLLGKVSIDGLILHASKGTLSAELTALIERSRSKMRRNRRNGIPPIYETYVFEKLGDRVTDERDANKRAYLRRKNVAALLSICSEFKITNVPYAGANIIVSLSNSCIRDYLELVGSIYDEAIRRREIKRPEDLTQRETAISPDTQRVGVRNSSRAKLDGIRNIIERDWAEATRTVEFLGKLTAQLQTNHTVESTLATPERGNFLFDLNSIEEVDPTTPRRELVQRVLRRCEADGLLRPVRATQSDDAEYELAFHIHRRFAPEFGFSYRGPYGLIKMPMHEFAEVCEGSGETLDALVERAYLRISRDIPIDHPKLL